MSTLLTEPPLRPTHEIFHVERILDPDESGGYGPVALTSIAITAGFVAIGSLLAWISRWHHRSLPRATEQTAMKPALPV